MKAIAMVGIVAMMFAAPVTGQFGMAAGEGCDYIDAGGIYITADDYIYFEDNGEAGLQRDADYEAQWFNHGCYDPEEDSPDIAFY